MSTIGIASKLDLSSRAQSQGADSTPRLNLQASDYLMTVDDVADFLHVHRSQVYRFLSSGRMPEPGRLGESPRWPLWEIEAWADHGFPNREQWEEIRKELMKKRYF